MSVFAVFEGQKRTTTSGDDAQQNGSFSLYELERQIRTAGAGMIQGNRYGLWGCPITAFSASTQRLPMTAAIISAPFNAWPTITRAVPILIADGGSDSAGHALPDVIGVVSGNPHGRVFKAAVTGTPDSATVVLSNSFGIFKNDYLLGILTNGSCALNLTTADPTVTNTITLSAPDGPSTGLVGTLGSYVFDMGPNPVLSLFGVDPVGHTLGEYDLLQRSLNGNPAAIIPIADGIVSMKALYGIHDGSLSPGEDPDVIDKWVQPNGANWSIAALNASTASAFAAMNQIKAIRVVVVAQSKLPERAKDYIGSSTMVLFPDLAPALRYTITTQTQFRYKVYDTTIPIRNALITKYF